MHQHNKVTVDIYTVLSSINIERLEFRDKGFYHLFTAK